VGGVEALLCNPAVQARHLLNFTLTAIRSALLALQFALRETGVLGAAIIGVVIFCEGRLR
jgi:hypothetical protein